MRHLVTVIDWYGPYLTLEAANEAAKSSFSSGLYLCIGRQESDPMPPKIQYIGIAQKSMATRVCKEHHKLKFVVHDFNIWMGEVSSLESPGRRNKKTIPSLDYAEWALVFFMKPSLNKKKMLSKPQRSVTVLNRWWRTDFETPWVQRRHSDWPDLIDYLGPEHQAKLVWFKNVKRVPA